MSTPDGTSQDTGSTALTEEQAADRIASLLSRDGDSDGGETEEEESSDQADEEEQSPEDAEESDDEADEPKDPEEQPEATAYTVKIDGEEVKVTLDEALKGYQRAQDYTRKTMAVAEERKALEAEKAQLAPQRDAYREALNRLEAFFAQAEEDPADLAQLRHADPAEYAARVAEKQERQRQLSAIQAEQARIDAQKAHEQASQRAAVVREEEAKLLSAVPEWSDQAKRAAEQAQIVDYALNTLGLKPEEINDVYDHRLVLALRDAAKWRALQAKKPAVQARVEAVKTAKPGSAAAQPAKVTQATRAKQRLAKTGRVEDAARALEHILG